MLKVHGVRQSPFVRKVLAVLEMKGLQYEVIDVFPFAQKPEFTKISPLGKIPALEDGALTLADSTVICEYLDEQYPAFPTLPVAAADRANARWLEEFADTKLDALLVGAVFYEVVVKPVFLKQEADSAKLELTINTLLPPVLDYLETRLPAEGYLFGSFGRAEISLVTPFINAGYADYTVDAVRWPKLAAFIERVKQHPAFAGLLAIESTVLPALLGKK